MQRGCNSEKISVWAHPKSVISKRSLGLKEQPREVSRLKRRCLAATLPRRAGSEEALFGCPVYGLKGLARSQVTYNGRGVRETPCTHNSLFSSLNDSWKNHPLFVYESQDPSSSASILTGSPVSLCSPRGAPGPATAQTLTSAGARTNLLLVWVGGPARPSQQAGWRSAVGNVPCAVRVPISKVVSLRRHTAGGIQD